MKKLTKEQLKEKAELVFRLQEARAKIEDAIADYNDELLEIPENQSVFNNEEFEITSISILRII